MIGLVLCSHYLESRGDKPNPDAESTRELIGSVQISQTSPDDGRDPGNVCRSAEVDVCYDRQMTLTDTDD
jgi:hypothetical protein